MTHFHLPPIRLMVGRQHNGAPRPGPASDMDRAMWIDDHGYLWMPAAELNRIGLLQKGESEIQLPAHVYKSYVGEKPPKSDHP